MCIPEARPRRCGAIAADRWAQSARRVYVGETWGPLMNSLFARQLAKATKPGGALDLDLLGQLVSGAYEQAHHDRQRTDRSIALMIEELDRLNRGLEQLVEER